MIRAALIGATRFLVGGQGLWLGCAPSPRQRIYFANHGSHLDTILLWSALPEPLRRTTHPVAAADYWGKGRIRRHIAIKMLNAVLIERQAPRRVEGGPLSPLKAVLANGHSLIIFPEGTRGSERLPARFKSGLFHLAEKFPEAELVPVYLDNLRRAFPKGAYLPVPIFCVARFGTPITLAPGEDKGDFLERARGAVAALS
jgi:1-acyl-sn-glycerol-3-phosphate acyltransferase